MPLCFNVKAAPHTSPTPAHRPEHEPVVAQQSPVALVDQRHISRRLSLPHKPSPIKRELTSRLDQRMTVPTQHQPIRRQVRISPPCPTSSSGSAMVGVRRLRHAADLAPTTAAVDERRTGGFGEAGHGRTRSKSISERTTAPTERPTSMRTFKLAICARRPRTNASAVSADNRSAWVSTVA